MNFGKKHTDQFFDKTKDALDEFGDQVKERTHKIAHRVYEDPVPSLLIAIGVGVILSGLLLSKISKR